MSLISYIKQLWDTTSFVNPTRLNHMEDGIKSACDGVDAISKDATTTEAGLMSASDKAKLDGIESGATASSGTITGITMNGASKGTSGVVNLGTVVTDVSGKQDTVDNSLGTSAKTIVGAINEVNTGLAGKSDTSHNHDSRYYTESEIDTKLSNIGSTHNHDDRYYTESEVDTKIGYRMLKPTILYNKSSMSAQGATTISLSYNISNYDYYEVIFAPEYNNDLRMSTGLIPVTSSALLFACTPHKTDKILLYRRYITPISNTATMQVGNGWYFAGINSSAGVEYTGCCVVSRVIGYKF